MDADCIGNIALEQIQAELRAISGTPTQDEADRMRRRALWRRLDLLVALEAAARQE
jgi:hypothetical protein